MYIVIYSYTNELTLYSYSGSPHNAVSICLVILMLKDACLILSGNPPPGICKFIHSGSCVNGYVYPVLMVAFGRAFI